MICDARDPILTISPGSPLLLYSLTLKMSLILSNLTLLLPPRPHTQADKPCFSPSLPIALSHTRMSCVHGIWGAVCGSAD